MLLSLAAGCVTTRAGGATDAAAAPAFTTGLRASEQRSLTKIERETLDFAGPGAARQWTGAGNNKGALTASAPFRVAGGDCRLLRYDLNLLGESVAETRTFCRRDGQWALIS